MTRHKPATAYDYRRYIELVQILAAYGNDDGIKALCEAWGVERVVDPSNPYRSGGENYYYTNIWSTIRKLAQAAIEYHQNENNDESGYEITEGR
jgi:hypothetical protein